VSGAEYGAEQAQKSGEWECSLKKYGAAEAELEIRRVRVERWMGITEGVSGEQKFPPLHSTHMLSITHPLSSISSTRVSAVLRNNISLEYKYKNTKITFG